MKYYNIKNAVLMKKGGNLMFCKDCNKIVGSINKEIPSYINIKFTCTCDSIVTRSVEIANEKYEQKRVGNALKSNKFGLYSCKKCNSPLFSIVKERVASFCFHVKCSCGEIYDEKLVFEKRLGETLRRIKKMSV